MENNLKCLRSKFGFSQQHIADYLGISKTSYHNKETGEREFKLNECKKISELFSMKIDEIFFGEQVSFK